MSKKPAAVKLTAKWQLDAALLSRPVDLNALVTLSKSNPNAFIDQDKTLDRIVGLISDQNVNKCDKDTKLDAVNILANVAYGGKEAVNEVRNVLQGVSEWFDDYIAKEEEDPDAEPELHKAMVLLLARCWNYKLKTEDVLELTRGNRRIALCTVVGLLEDGETYSTELKQRQRPGEGQMGQWEHELVIERYEKPLLLQICRLLRGFTHPGTYFEATDGELALYSVEKFADEMSTLLDITLKSNLVEKLSSALYECLFGLNRVRDSGGGTRKKGNDMVNDNSNNSNDDVYHLQESDHIAVVSVNAFIQNLYFYASSNNEVFRMHILEETLFIPRLILPYLEVCIAHVSFLSSQSNDQITREASKEDDDDDQNFGWWTHFPQLVSGISSSLRSLIISTFRASYINLLSSSLLKQNPSIALLRVSSFCIHHEYIFALMCILNINAGAVDISNAGSRQYQREKASSLTASPVELLDKLASVYNMMGFAAKARVYRRVSSSGALPVSRDTPSYVAVMSVLSGGEAGQLRYASSASFRSSQDTSLVVAGEDTESPMASRAEAKAEFQHRLSSLAVDAEQPSNEGTSSTSQENNPTSTRRLSKAFAAADSKEDHYQSEQQDVKEQKQIESVPLKKTSKTAGPTGLSSLGDLPSLSVPKSHAILDNNDGSEDQGRQNRSKSKHKHFDPTIPKEFLCAINGHVMKDPVRCVSTNLVFEKSTIELWLHTRGAVCPITNTNLERKDLVPDDELRNKIMRYHIQQTSLRRADSNNDDLYDF